MPNKASTTATVDRVVYHTPDGNSFFVICEAGETEKYRKDPSIPLVNVVQAFQIFEGSGTNQVVAPKPSKSVLENQFGTTDENEIIKIILQKGKIQHTKSVGGTNAVMENKHH